MPFKFLKGSSLLMIEDTECNRERGVSNFRDHGPRGIWGRISFLFDFFFSQRSGARASRSSKRNVPIKPCGCKARWGGGRRSVGALPHPRGSQADLRAGGSPRPSVHHRPPRRPGRLDTVSHNVTCGTPFYDPISDIAFSHGPYGTWIRNPQPPPFAVDAAGVRAIPRPSSLCSPGCPSPAQIRPFVPPRQRS